MERLVRVNRVMGAALLAVPLAATAVRGQTIVAGPTTASLQATVGEQVTVPVAVDMTGAPGLALGGYRATLSWNPTQLKLIGAGSGAFGAAVFNTAPALDSGLARFTAVNTAGSTGVRTLATFTFQVLAGDLGSAIAAQFQELTASGTYQNLLPFLAATSGQFCAILQFGDLDGNGQVQSLDAQIVLMQSVGLALPAGVVVGRGDVTNDGKVDPRDALVILSAVIGLDVGAFRVLQPVSGPCVPGTPAAVTVIPGPVSAAAGDTVRLAAEVRDAGGTLLGGKNLAWSTNAPSVATVDAAGKVTAVGAGSAVITAAVAPGLTGTATVTVGPRHRWVVNQATAPGPGTQVGSDLLPFATIAQAIAAAAVDDTVAIALGIYHEPLSTTKRLVFLGDSSAAGLPAISLPAGAAGLIDVTGLQVIRRLRFTESASGLSIRAGAVDLSALGFVSLRGPALRVVGATRATLRDVNVNGAAGAGIFLDSAQVVDIARIRVTGVLESLVPVLSTPEFDVLAIGIFARADSVSVSQTTVQGILGPGVVTENSRRTSVQSSTITNTGGPEEGQPPGASSQGVRPGPANGRPDRVGLVADSAVTLDITNTVVRDAGSISASADTVRMTGVTVEITGGRDAIVVDPRPASGGPYDLLSLVNVQVHEAASAVRGAFGRRATITNSVFTDLDADALVPDADTVGVSNTVVQRVNGVALQVRAGAVVTVSGSRFLDTRFGGVWGQGVVRYLALTGSRVAGVQDGGGAGVYLTADSILLQNDTLVDVFGGAGVVADGAAWLKVRTSLLRRIGGPGILAATFPSVNVYGTTVDSTALLTGIPCDCVRPAASPAFTLAYGISLSSVANVVVDSSTIRYTLGPGLSVAATGTVAINRNLITDNQDAGLYVAASGPAPAGTLNSFRRNFYGLMNSSPAGGVFAANNFEGNIYGVYSDYLMDATLSWWGALDGPQCLGGATGCGSSVTGDYAYGAVDVSGYRTDGPVPGTPVGAPPQATGRRAAR